MKILYIITKSTSGGAQTHILQCASHMKSLGHAVAVMAHPGGWLETAITAQGIIFYPNLFLSNSYNPIGGFRAIRKIRSVVGEYQPDIVSCHSSAAGLWGRLAIHNSVPTIFTAHGWGFADGMKPIRRMIVLAAEKITACFAAKIICVSDADRSLALRYNIASHEKMVTIHNGVEDLECYQSIPGSGSENIRIVCVGRLVDPKRPEILLAAFHQLPAALREQAELIFVGDGPKQLLLKTMIHDFGLGDRVTLAGDVSREDVFRVLAVKNISGIPAIFCLISDHEGFPRSILEAMSLGCAVVASDAGGTREAIHDEAGILLEKGDRSLPDKLADLIQHPEKIISLGTAARNRMMHEFTLDRMFLDTYQVYKTVLKK